MNDRRRFLTVLGAAAGSVWMGCSSNNAASEASGPVAAGNVKSIAIGSIQAVGGQPVVIARDQGGLYAMTTICPHAQCDMTSQGTISATGLYCSCHGSTFDANGVVQSGSAARSSLRHWKVDLDAATGNITIEAGTEVASDVRVAVAMA
jgi:nitrite reductase/ring-hydroxylating ferredoxin subunit